VAKPIDILTIMVNTRKNLSAYAGTPPSDDQADRRIPDGPLYTREEVLAILATGEAAIKLWTQKCMRDVQKYDMEPADVVDLVKIALNGGKFKGSQWCTNKPGGAWAACDSYQLFFRQWIETANKHMDVEYYVKFAIGRSGNMMLIISCHPPEER
jgi:hypothetical protein